MTTTADVALYDDRAAVQSAPAGALAIEPGQTAWTPMQVAAFSQLGLADAPDGDRMVLLHVAQRTGLDPFARQLYMIGRRENKREQVNGRWTDNWTTKWGIQTGIEGFRVIRGRAERKEGVRGILSRPVYYNGQGGEFKVWFFKNPPAAVELTYTVRDRNGTETPYTSILRFDEYVQTRKQTVDGQETTVPSGQWATKPTHMLEKCCEADVYRKAFPQDYSGVDLDDAMPAPEPAQALPPERQVPDTAALRDRAAAQTVTATVVTPDASPAASTAADTPPARTQQAAGEAPPLPQAAAAKASTGQVGLIQRQLTRLGYAEDDRDARLRVISRIAGHLVQSSKDLSPDDARKVKDTLEGCRDGSDLDGVFADLALADDPRDEDEADSE